MATLILSRWHGSQQFRTPPILAHRFVESIVIGHDQASTLRLAVAQRLKNSQFSLCSALAMAPVQE
jgi:hypothetical protein